MHGRLDLCSSRNVLSRGACFIFGCLTTPFVQAAESQQAWPDFLALVPFVGLLVSIAVLPVMAADLWHLHRGKIALFWTLVWGLPVVIWQSWEVALHGLAESLLREYVPFILLTAALYTVSGGIHIRGRWRGNPVVNLLFMLAGALLASVMGTTGAAMLLVRPLLQANVGRRHQVHVFVFFIFIVANAAGVLTPLGDPPLFMGFLQGVPFTWTLVHLWPQAVFVLGALLALFGLLDGLYWNRETPHAQGMHLHRPVLDGARNLLFLVLIVGLLIWSGSPGDAAGAVPGLSSSVRWMGIELRWVDVLRNLGLLGVILLSLRLTPPRVYVDNQFNWAPLVEVAQLFAALFVTMAPVLALLKQGSAGPFASLLTLVSRPDGLPDPMLYFWVTGGLSAILDNAPTYLVFFNAAGGRVDVLTGPYAQTLAAISTASVFMGALTYIGNAPNLMVRSIALERGVAMPSFLGYMKWSCLIMLPLMSLTSMIWFVEK